MEVAKNSLIQIPQILIILINYTVEIFKIKITKNSFSTNSIDSIPKNPISELKLLYFCYTDKKSV